MPRKRKSETHDADVLARGLTVREIHAFLAELYATEVSPELISSITDAVVAEVTAWQTRLLEPLYPVVFCKVWRRVWTAVIPFFAVPPEVRRIIYTTNALDSVHARIRKVIKTRGHFPNDDAATKLIWLALRNITAEWRRPAHHWRAAMNQFAILYEDRFTKAMI